MPNRLEIDVIEDLQWSREILTKRFCVVKRYPSDKNICEQLAGPNLVCNVDMVVSENDLRLANCQLLFAHLKCIAASLSFSLPSLRRAFWGMPYLGLISWQPSQ
jgi:hypothetical protein